MCRRLTREYQQRQRINESSGDIVYLEARQARTATVQLYNAMSWTVKHDATELKNIINLPSAGSSCTVIRQRLRLKPGFHYPSSRAELTARQLGFFYTPQLGPSTRVSKNAPEFTGRELG